MPLQRSTICAVLTTTALLLPLSGCALLDLSGSLFDRSRSLLQKKSTHLPALTAPNDSIQLEIVFIERPIEDPLLKDVLWREVDQVSALSPDARKSLESNGFRVGHVGSSPPRALQTLLGMTTELAPTGGETDSRQLTGRRVWLRPNSTAEVQTSQQYNQCTVGLQDEAGSDSHEYHNARCVFRVKADRLQEGWARVEFTPEIHHGQLSMRHVATEGGWEMKSTQEIEPLFSQRFSIAMNTGELAIITAGRDHAGSAGQHFFLGAEAKAKVQRVLVVRLADIRDHEAVYGP